MSLTFEEVVQLATRDLLGAERATELIRQREEAEATRKRPQELELAARLANAEADEAARLANEEAEEAEFAALVSEFSRLGFSESRAGATSLH